MVNILVVDVLSRIGDTASLATSTRTVFASHDNASIMRYMRERADLGSHEGAWCWQVTRMPVDQVDAVAERRVFGHDLTMYSNAAQALRRAQEVLDTNRDLAVQQAIKSAPGMPQATRDSLLACLDVGGFDTGSSSLVASIRDFGLFHQQLADIADAAGLDRPALLIQGNPDNRMHQIYAMLDTDVEAIFRGDGTLLACQTVRGCFNTKRHVINADGGQAEPDWHASMVEIALRAAGMLPETRGYAG